MRRKAPTTAKSWVRAIGIHMVVHVDSTAPAGYYTVNHGTCNAPG